jgi:hypothetical protein
MQPSRSVRVAGNIIAPIGFAGHIPLRLIPIGNDELMAELETATTMSDADGAFSFPAVPPGQYVLRAIRVPRLPAGPDADEGNRTTIVRSGSVTIASSAVPNPGPMAPPPIPADSTLCADVALAVGETDLTGIMITLRTGPRMSGRVEFDGSGNRPDAMALANMRISLDPVDGSTLPEGVGFVTGRVDETGQFTTYGVPPGKYFVRVSGLSDWFFKGALYEDRDLSDTPIELGAEDVSGVVLTFTDRPSSIAGTVRTKHAADGNAVVFAFPMERAEWLGTGTAPRRMRTARANRDGSYVFPALPPGDYYVVAATEDFIEDWRDPAFLETISGSAEQVHVNEGERRTLDLLTTPIR